MPQFVFGAVQEVLFDHHQISELAHLQRAALAFAGLLLGFNHTQLTYKFQGRPFRLTDVHGEVVRPLLA